MPFLENDYYLTKGTDKIVRGDWTSSVYKYDASSFYNWEQDNLPLYDLEERTEFNWEQHGYAGSSLNGLQLVVVSGTGDTAAPYQQFSSLQNALNALPRTLRFPVIIEVAASGNLGNVDIYDFEFVESGGLEIINRGFAKVLATSSTIQGTYALSSTGTGTSSIATVSSVDLNSTLSSTSAVGISTNIKSIFESPYNRSFVRVPDHYSYAISNQEAYGTAGSPNPTADMRPNNITVNITNTTAHGLLAGANTFAFSKRKVFSTLDYSKTAPYYGMRGSSTNNLAGTINNNITGGIYANSLNSLKIKNCNGDIFVRGFCVDGLAGSEVTDESVAYTTKEGIVVENSNVVLENCAVMRCSQAGARLTNSRVTLNRGFTAYRVYDLTGNNVRSSHAAYGLVAHNSDVMLSGANDITKGIGVDNPFTFSHNHTGIQLNNSTLRSPQGGRGYDIEGTKLALEGDKRPTIPYRQLYLDTMLNTHVGLECNNSNVDMYHTIMAFQNTVGIKSWNSNLILDEIVCDHNSEVGLKADSSVIEYYRTKHGYPYGQGYGAATSLIPNKIISFLRNGKNLELRNSTFKEPPFSDFKKDNIYNQYEIEGGGYKKIGSTVVPGATLDNSVCRLMMVGSLNGVSKANYTDDGVPTVGSAYKAQNNSYLKFISASSTVPSGVPETLIGGPSADYISIRDTVAVYAEDNSVVEFNGPTRFIQAGINVGVNNNSTVKLLPHNEDGTLEITKYSLSDANMHTKIMAQSFKACFAANNNSTILMKDCGSFNRYWTGLTNAPAGLVASSTYNPKNVNGTSYYTSGGFVQFFPNPILHEDTSSVYLDSSAPLSGGVYPVMNSYNVPTVGDLGDPFYAKYSLGGYCVKADKGSEVKVKNVHFPCGFQNPSSTILDLSAGASGTSCGKTYIWGIGDDSRLHASHISVSGNYPEDVPYNGPSGVYVSAEACDGVYLPLSSAPSSTLDTGRISILDSYGPQSGFLAHTNGAGAVTVPKNIFKRTTPANKGPFRIYFSVRPIANFIGYTRGKFGSYQLSSNLDAGYTWFNADNNLDPSAVEVGEPYQELAQGYNPSRDCSATWETTLSSIYTELAFQNVNAGNTSLSTTFFYASGMVDPSYENRIWLDDSAMNTFANAKNATTGTSGRPRLVSYYRAVTDKYGEGYAGDRTIETTGYREDYGLGFKSSNIFDFEDRV